VRSELQHLIGFFEGRLYALGYARVAPDATWAPIGVIVVATILSRGLHSLYECNKKGFDPESETPTITPSGI
jgi:hypothetical protein